MIYTYDTTTGQVVMVSDAKNTYTNPNWADVEADEAPFLAWCEKESDEDVLKVDLEKEEVIFEKS